MPVYTARCLDCGNVQNYFRTIAERHNLPQCDACDAQTEKVLDAVPIGAMGLTSGSFNMTSPIDGSQIHGRSEYFAHMAKHNVRPMSDFDGQAAHVKKQQAVDRKKEYRKAAEDAYRIVRNK